MLPDPVDKQAQTAAATNNTIGNKFRFAEWANSHLATTREDNWICTRGTGISSYYSNPKKAVHTLFNWHKIAFSDSDLNNIEYIDSLKQPTLLAASVQKAFLAKGITLTRGYKDLADVFACTEPEINPILIAAVAKVYELYKKHDVTTPQHFPHHIDAANRSSTEQTRLIDFFSFSDVHL